MSPAARASSAAAVSFAVNDRPGVSTETRERILVAARELGWRPSASARALTEARTRAIGLVLARDVAHLEVDAFFVRFLSGIERALTAADYALLLQLVPDGAAAALPAYERLAAAGRVDGFLLTDVELDDPRFAVLEAAGVPVVLAGRPVGRVPVPVGGDAPRRGDGRAGRAPRGARPRADLVPRRAGGLRARAGACGALAFGRVARRASRKGWSCTPTTTRAAAAVVLAGAPTAVVCASDALAMALVVAARDAGLDVPGDLSVTGFDDSPLAALGLPPLTSVRVDYAEFGEAAARRAAGRDRRGGGARVLALGAGARGAGLDRAAAGRVTRHGDRHPHRLRHLRPAGLVHQRV